MSAETKATNITWHEGEIPAEDRQKEMNQRGVILWLTGLSACGKSTIARDLEFKLFNDKRACYVLDGDNVRHGLNKDLGFSPEDREENIRRIGEVAGLFVDSNLITITAFISPYRKDRDIARSIVKDGQFVEVYVKCALDVCEERDPKGLYKKAREGKIPEFTGISAPYEEPENAEIVIDSGELGVGEASDQLYNYLKDNNYIS